MLNKTIKLYIPSTQGLSKPITSEQLQERVKTVALEFSKLYGGATAKTNNLGFYIANNSELVQERVIELESYTDSKTLTATKDKILKLAKQLKKQWEQESMMLVLDNQAIFI